MYIYIYTCARLYGHGICRYMHMIQKLFPSLMVMPRYAEKASKGEGASADTAWLFTGCGSLFFKLRTKIDLEKSKIE